MFSDPAKNVPYFGLTEGAKVADFGTGSGAYVFEMAKQVGNTGKIYAIDIQQGLLDRLSSQVHDLKLKNNEIVWGNVEKVGGSKLADQSVDLVLIANILFQSDSKYTLALEAKRILAPDGQAVVIDWIDSFGNLGPPPDRVVPPDQVKQIFAEAGFLYQSEFPAGDHHYGLIFAKKK